MRLSAARHADHEAGLRPAASRAEGLGTLAGLRVLIVEDEFLVAIAVEDALHGLGCATLGPFTTLGCALEAAGREAFDIAVLDINLGGDKVYPVADVLAGRGIPYLFLTGYGPADLPAAHRDQPRLQKPFEIRAMERLLERLTRE